MSCMGQTDWRIQQVCPTVSLLGFTLSLDLTWMSAAAAALSPQLSPLLSCPSTSLMNCSGGMSVFIVWSAGIKAMGCDSLIFCPTWAPQKYVVMGPFQYSIKRAHNTLELLLHSTCQRATKVCIQCRKPVSDHMMAN